MTYTVQIVIDSADPHVLADWWAETLGWRVEEQDAAFIRQMIDAGHATETDTRVHHGALVWKEGAAIHPARKSRGVVPGSCSSRSPRRRPGRTACTWISGSATRTPRPCGRS